jgi:magnesium chelatase subunit H
MPVDDYVRREPHLSEIEAVWGAAPGRVQSDGASLHILGVQLGNVFVGVQPAFGYEGDPMRLMFEGGHAPNHAFSAFYHFLREDFDAHSVLHFGTHGALEFMPGKQVGLADTCWPERLIGDLPNFYLYAANNPSEATIAKRRAAATVVTHLTPPLAASGLYRELADVSGMLERLRTLAADDEERRLLWQLIREKATSLGFESLPECLDDRDIAVRDLMSALAEVEQTLIPIGMHVVGAPADDESRRAMLAAVVDTEALLLPERIQDRLLAREPVDEIRVALENEETLEEAAKQQGIQLLPRLVALLEAFDGEQELPALVNALDGAFVPPAAGGDILRNPDVLPTGRNIHGFDPMRMPSSFACEVGQRQADELLRTWRESRVHSPADGQTPATVAMVLWGTDNLKSEGVSVGQVLALIGALPRFDAYGRLSGARLVPLADLGRPRVDVLVTLSGIFRDLLPNQIRLLSEAALLAAEADEPLDQNPVRRHALAYQEAHGVTLEEAALRVFSNADGVYGANVNHMIDNGLWQQDEELGEMFAKRKCFAYGVDAKPVRQETLLHSLFAEVDLTYQNLDSVEVGVTTVDHYFDSLGGISKAVEKERGEMVPSYIGDQTRGQTSVRTLADQVALETRTRLLNPKWYQEMFNHGHEGVHQLEVHITNTLGWSATTGAVAPWVYDKLTETFLLDEAMRDRMAELNPAASLKLANRLLEAHERNYWQPADEVLDALKHSGDALEDRMEGVGAIA